MKKRAIFLDWDGVVADDRATKERLFELAASLGVKSSSLLPIYHQTKNANGYHHRGFSEYIANLTGLNVDDVHADLLKAFDESHLMLRTGVKDFLKARQRDFDLYIISAGDDWLQRHKITSSGLSDYFTDITIVGGPHIEQGKIDHVESVAQHYEQSFFFDDRLVTILAAHHQWRRRSDIIPIWVNRDETMPNSCLNGFVVTALDKKLFRPNNSFYSRGKTLIAGAVVRQDDRVVLVKESTGASEGLWTLPIGHVDGEDSFEQTAARELREETGIMARQLEDPRLVVVDGGYYGGSDYDVDRAIVICLYETSVMRATDESEHAYKWRRFTNLKQSQIRGGEWQYPLLRSYAKKR